MRALADADLAAAMEQILDFVAGGSELASKMTPVLRSKLVAAMPGLKERAKTLVELFEGSRFIWANRPLTMDEQAKAALTPEAKTVLAAIIPRFETIADWNAASTEAVLRAYTEEAAVKLGTVAQPLRAALTGKTTSPPIFDVLAVLGKEESLGRLREQLASEPARV
jgi:glutamyl-tRNA synthetase